MKIKYEREKEDIRFDFEGKKYWAEEYDIRTGDIISKCNICEKRGVGIGEAIAIPTKISLAADDDPTLYFDEEQRLLKKIEKDEEIIKKLSGKLRLIRKKEEKKYFVCHKCIKNNTPEELEKLLALIRLKELRLEFKKLLKQKKKMLERESQVPHELEEKISGLAKEILDFQEWEDS